MIDPSEQTAHDEGLPELQLEGQTLEFAAGQAQHVGEEFERALEPLKIEGPTASRRQLEVGEVPATRIAHVRPGENGARYDAAGVGCDRIGVFARAAHLLYALRMAFPLHDPTREQLIAAREAAGLTQKDAAERAMLSAQTRWAEYESGTRNIDSARWQLFLLHTDQHPIFRLVKRKKAPRRAKSSPAD